MKRRQFLSATAAGAAGWLVASPGASQEHRGEASPSTTEGDQTAEPQPAAESLPEITWSRKVPVRYQADVAVIGGGIAGVCAAAAPFDGLIDAAFTPSAGLGSCA